MLIIPQLFYKVNHLFSTAGASARSGNRKTAGGPPPAWRNILLSVRMMMIPQLDLDQPQCPDDILSGHADPPARAEPSPLGWLWQSTTLSVPPLRAAATTSLISRADPARWCRPAARTAPSHAAAAVQRQSAGRVPGTAPRQSVLFKNSASCSVVLQAVFLTGRGSWV